MSLRSVVARTDVLSKYEKETRHPFPKLGLSLC